MRTTNLSLADISENIRRCTEKPASSDYRITWIDGAWRLRKIETFRTPRGGFVTISTVIREATREDMTSGNYIREDCGF